MTYILETISAVLFIFFFASPREVVPKVIIKACNLDQHGVNYGNLEHCLPFDLYNLLPLSRPKHSNKWSVFTWQPS